MVAGVKVVLKVAYDGSAFAGFQRQPEALTVQGCLEQAVAQVLGQQITLQGAGRTDVGVHATGQVVSFLLQREVSIARLCRSVNAVLRAPVVVVEGVTLDGADPFHARFSASSRSYSYFLLDGCGPAQEMFWKSKAWCLPKVVELEKAQRAAKLFLGEQDFSTFSYRMTEKPTRVRTVQEISLQAEPASSFLAPRAGPRLLTLSITADGFLRRMVRLIVAAVAEVGMGMRTLESVQQLLQARDPSRPPHPAPPEGLYLSHVGYDPDPFECHRGTERHAVAPLSIKHRFRNL